MTYFLKEGRKIGPEIGVYISKSNSEHNLRESGFVMLISALNIKRDLKLISNNKVIFTNLFNIGFSAKLVWDPEDIFLFGGGILSWGIFMKIPLHEKLQLGPSVRYDVIVPFVDTSIPVLVLRLGVKFTFLKSLCKKL